MADLGSVLGGAPYHVGIIVPDLDEGMRRYGALFGLAWGERLGARDAVEIDGGRRELDFAAVNVDPQIQNAFAKAKGSTPLRTDAPLDGIDQCSLNVIAALKDPNITSFPTPHNTADADWLNTTWDVMFKFWSDPTMTADAAIQQLKDGFDAVFG